MKELNSVVDPDPEKSHSGSGSEQLRIRNESEKLLWKTGKIVRFL
jgi:hypothetical protein